MTAIGLGAALYLDAEQVVRDWLNDDGDLVGRGNPISLGAKLNHPAKSPSSGAYAFLTAGRAREDGIGLLLAPIYAQIYGHTKKSALIAAIAYANKVRTLYVANQKLPSDDEAAAICAGVDDLSGPLWAPDNQAARYLVDATFYLVPA